MSDADEKKAKREAAWAWFEKVGPPPDGITVLAVPLSDEQLKALGWWDEEDETRAQACKLASDTDPDRCNSKA